MRAAVTAMRKKPEQSIMLNSGSPGGGTLTNYFYLAASIIVPNQEFPWKLRICVVSVREGIHRPRTRRSAPQSLHFTRCSFVPSGKHAISIAGGRLVPQVPTDTLIRVSNIHVLIGLVISVRFPASRNNSLQTHNAKQGRECDASFRKKRKKSEIGDLTPAFSRSRIATCEFTFEVISGVMRGQYGGKLCAT